MLKILVIGHLPIDLGNIRGGVEAVIFNMLEGYHNSNIKVKIFSLTHEVSKAEKIYFSNNISINYYPYGFTKSTKLGALLNGRRFLKKVINEFDPDIIHFQGNGSQLLLSLGLNSQKLVITPHGMLNEEYKYAAKFMTKVNLKLALYIESLLIKKFHNFIFIAYYAKKYFFYNYKYLNNPLVKFEVIPNPITQIFFTEPHYPNSIKNIIFIGSISPLKGLDLLLSAIANIKTKGYNISLTVVGGFKDDVYKKKIDSQIEKLNLSETVNFEGWQKQEKVYELLKNSDCFVLPSYQETLPVSIIEAMSMGKIVVSSNVGGCPEMIQNDVNGFLFKRGDIDDLTRVLFNIIKITNLITIAKNAHLTALNNYQSNKVAEKVIAFYQSLLINKISLK